ncbi:hypothetical protein FE257_005467 [Aspergillus nanangensis]|uniref:Crh-like protein n=1 Tax=Aspergillus nanangensis TaxID=2582783 RepID=A0AAD4GVK6_ASPNN|nr:hypothetical protein FE257_005467 [Aspergillus nanangensis]
MPSYLQWAVATLSVAAQCTAQTYTNCNPTKKTCNPDPGLRDYTFSTDFTSGQSAFDHWNITAGSVESTELGAAFTINKQGDAPTIQSKFYIFFGYVEFKLRASNGTGIISTAVLQSDDLDEIDWEQISTFPNSIQTNYFGKGNSTTYDRAQTTSVTTPEDTFHTYAVHWTSDKLEWLLDGSVVRTLNYADAVGGSNYPQTPMYLKIGIWAGGDPTNEKGTIQWAGGKTDYSVAPFKMWLQEVKVVNYNPADQYKYGDLTGDWGSIKAENTTGSSSSSSSTTTTTSSSSSKTRSDEASGGSEGVTSSKTTSSKETVNDTSAAESRSVAAVSATGVSAASMVGNCLSLVGGAVVAAIMYI